MEFQENGIREGDITVSVTTFSYNAFTQRPLAVATEMKGWYFNHPVQEIHGCQQNGY